MTFTAKALSHCVSTLDGGGVNSDVDAINSKEKVRSINWVRALGAVISDVDANPTRSPKKNEALEWVSTLGGEFGWINDERFVTGDTSSPAGSHNTPSTDLVAFPAAGRPNAADRLPGHRATACGSTVDHKKFCRLGL